MTSRAMLTGLAIAAAAAIGLWALFGRAPAVNGVRATTGPALDLVYATGFVEPERPVTLASRVTAPVVAVLADEGMAVRAGQTLVLLDDGEQRAQIAQLAAQTRESDAAEQRALTLFARGFLAAAGRDRAVAAARSARAAEAGARARLGQFALRAGLDGVVLRRDVEPGDLASPSRTLMTLGDPARLRVTATVDERDIPRIAPGQRVLMSTAAYPGRIMRGRVRAVTPGGDPDQRAFRVRIAPDAGPPLPVGLTLEVNIVTAARDNAVLVPSRALRDGQIWTAEGGTARPVRVTAGIEGGERTEIRQGLTRNACVLPDPPPGLRAGQRIRLGGC
ncbi:efflux RND transporter periplasmic adaptor subunit [Sphingomonas changnyeongensis]|uniref:Efflux RND transporter periplasmic adaptor subunit n=1 Tax=Sphingomonas changnyeongensis TaxID=2698679 RepID=A0A7Z2NVV5_9SPHN|nr:efflux RND transporter periplasmic adaptor subunit [Sphingomonas changnyeongensis]QHL90768.1 efflux RND transporter periplasmic adaptor subunit [Sphingomonas changnyeongensis]